MGFLRGAMKTGIALKAAEMIKREASKPENQRKAKAMLNRVMNKGGQRKRAPR